MAYLTLGVGYILVYAAIGWLLRDQPLALSIFGDIGLLVPALAVSAAILRRRRVWRGCHRLFWDTVAIGVGLWIVGHLGWTFEDLFLKRQSWLQWHTVFSLCGGICPLIALLARPHRGVRAEAVGAVGLVLASYGLLTVFIYSYFILIPGITPGGRDERMALLTFIQLNRALLFAGSFAVMIVARRTSWFAAYRWLAIATGVGFFLRILTSLAIVRGSYQSGTLYDLAWIVPFLCYAAAALAAPESPAESDAIEAPAPLARARVRDSCLHDSARRLRHALPPADRRSRRFVPRAAHQRHDGRRPRPADASPGRSRRRAGARGRADAAARCGNRADRRISSSSRARMASSSMPTRRSCARSVIRAKSS